MTEVPIRSYLICFCFHFRFFVRAHNGNKTLQLFLCYPYHHTSCLFFSLIKSFGFSLFICLEVIYCNYILKIILYYFLWWRNKLTQSTNQWTDFYMIGTSVMKELMWHAFSNKDRTLNNILLNPLCGSYLFLCLLKTSENIWFFDVFRGYWKRPVVWNELRHFLQDRTN